ncbi:MAG: hypothetical protein IPI84_02670 [Holophagaceae bacterium]|nr:hypothetical protein [Holophagaceae bacterium]
MFKKFILLSISIVALGCKPRPASPPSQEVQGQKVLDPDIKAIVESALLQYQYTSANIYENKTYFLIACKKLESSEYESSIITRFFVIDRASKTLIPMRQKGIHEEAQEPPTRAIHMDLKDPEFAYFVRVTQPLKPSFKVY